MLGSVHCGILELLSLCIFGLCFPLDVMTWLNKTATGLKAGQEIGAVTWTDRLLNSLSRLCKPLYLPVNVNTSKTWAIFPRCTVSTHYSERSVKQLSCFDSVRMSNGLLMLVVIGLRGFYQLKLQQGVVKVSVPQLHCFDSLSQLPSCCFLAPGSSCFQWRSK